MKHILIAGDSWGRGEWSGLPNIKTIHSGISRYLKDDGYIVENCSQGGSTNEIQTQRIHNRIKEKTYDYIFWFQTDPLRHRYQKNQKLIAEDAVSLSHFLEVRETCINNVYQQLNNLGVDIYCIGGCASLSDSISNYDNLHAVIKFIPKWIIPDREFPLTINQDWEYDILRNSDNEVYDFLLNDKKCYDNFIQQSVFDIKSVEHKYFYPDGVHLNRKGHWLLYEYIKTNILKDTQ